MKKRLILMIFLFVFLQIRTSSSEVVIGSYPTDSTNVIITRDQGDSFLSLIDTPDSYSGGAGSCLIVDQTETEVILGNCSNATLSYTETDPIFSLNFTNAQEDCPAGNYSYGVEGNGSLKCRDDLTGTSSGDGTGGWINDSIQTNTSLNVNILSGNLNIGDNSIIDIGNSTFTGSNYSFNHQGQTSFYVNGSKWAYFDPLGMAFDFLKPFVFSAGNSITMGDVVFDEDGIWVPSGNIKIGTSDAEDGKANFNGMFYADNNADTLDCSNNPLINIGSADTDFDSVGNLNMIGTNITANNISATGKVCDSVGCIGDGGSFDNTNVAYLNNTQSFTGENTFTAPVSINNRTAPLLSLDADNFIGSTTSPIFDVTGNAYQISVIALAMKFLLNVGAGGTAYTQWNEFNLNNLTQNQKGYTYYGKYGVASGITGGTKTAGGILLEPTWTNLATATASNFNNRPIYVSTSSISDVPVTNTSVNYTDIGMEIERGAITVYDFFGSYWNKVNSTGIMISGYGGSGDDFSGVNNYSTRALFSDGGDFDIRNGDLLLNGSQTIDGDLVIDGETKGSLTYLFGCGRASTSISSEYLRVYNGLQMSDTLGMVAPANGSITKLSVYLELSSSTAPAIASFHIRKNGANYYSCVFSAVDYGVGHHNCINDTARGEYTFNKWDNLTCYVSEYLGGGGAIDIDNPYGNVWGYLDE